MKTERLHIVLNMICAGVILFNAFSVSLLKLDLEMQRDFIAEVFCINKDKAKMSCHGQCFINKELKKESEKQQETSETLQKEVVLDLPMHSELILPEEICFVDQVTSSFAYTGLLKPLDDVGQLFRPPIV
ncbi:hypothetical protein [Flammeovirga aprica]|uniref:Uncharacterized protein n=1 Tax=Flammeovirga aprica JL-4 TaxID=694437 RepID=A0A7X9RUJ3_9BACT|nr:hypothetical protein [Flammeovirga aprica]NME68987.1 hypothetical protein [Flammeovirga aprica JL-4]